MVKILLVAAIVSIICSLFVNYLKRRGGVLGHGRTCTSTSALYEDVRFFQNVRLSEDLAEGTFNYVFNEMFLESANLIIMTIEMSREEIIRKLSRTSQDIAAFAQLLDEDDWYDLMPSYYCEHTDVFEEWDKGVVGYRVRFRQPFIKFNKGDFDDDIFE